VKNTPGKLNHVMVQDQHQKSCAAAKREPCLPFQHKGIHQKREPRES